MKNNIKWIGIIKDEIGNYQKGDLSNQAVKMDTTKSMKDNMIKAMPFAVVSIIILSSSMFIKTYLAGRIVINPFYVIVGFIIGILLLLVHELLHAIVYPKNAQVYIGLYPKTFAAVALCSYPIRRKRFVLMCLLPYILGVIPLLLFIVSPPGNTEFNGLMYGVSILGLVSPYPDLYNVTEVLKKSPSGCRVQFYEDDIYYIEK